VIVFWAWFARTPELVQEHIDNVLYEVTYFDGNRLPNLDRTEIRQIGRDYWVFYTATLGNVVPASYPITFVTRWRNPISDGYADFGPGTKNEVLISNCAFTVRPNPGGTEVGYDFP
jgi:hypothetical protein